MGSHRAREERRTIFLKVRLRTDEGWRDVTIGNVSLHGLMLRGPSLPPKGAFIEVRHRSVCIIGRIVWSNGSCCGVRTQDVVDIAALLSQPLVVPRKDQPERRQAARSRHDPSPAQSLASRVESSRRFARIFDWSLVAAGGALAAAGVASAAATAMDQPLHQVRTALQQSSGDDRS
jgi:hypothetical protein